MFDYIASDLHLGHDNIIEYCNRPFDTVEEMDESIIGYWNSLVNKSDSVLFLGDLTLAGEEIAIEYLDKLNGDITFIQGNHDRLKMRHDSVHVYDNLTFTYMGHKFYVAHEPYNYSTDIPNQWLLHGHTHNNELEDYPFMDSGKQTINTSIELIGYYPLDFDWIVNKIEDGAEKLTHHPRISLPGIENHTREWSP
jgi:calcineurin-like phosphoesterase family protein